MQRILQVTLLGRVGLAFSSGEDVPAELLQTRKLALLAFLGTEHRAVARGEIAALLWGDVPEERARKSLNSLLHAIRRDVSGDIFVAAGAALRLNPELVECDVAAFYAACEQLPPEDVIRQYRGPFMPGFAVSGAAGFEEWYAEERERFDVALADVAWRAAERCADARAAIGYLEVAARARPWDQLILRRRMLCLSQLGEHAAALALYESYRTQLREALGTAPARETVALATSLVAAADAAPAANTADTVHATTTVPQAAVARPLLRMSRRRVAQLSAALVMVVAMALAKIISSRAAGTTHERPVVTLSALTLTGGDTTRQNELLDRLTALLAEDTTYVLRLSNATSSDLLVSGTLDLDAVGMRGTIVLKSRPGIVLATLPLTPGSQSDALAVDELAQRIRRTIAIALASDDASRTALRFEHRIADATQHTQHGAFDLAAAALDDVERELSTAHMPAHETRTIRSRVWERRAWLALYHDQRAVAVTHLEHAIEALSAPDELNTATRQRLAGLHYLTWSMDTLDESPHLRAALAHVQAVPLRARTPQLWLRFAEALYHLGRYDEAYSAGDQARERSPAKAASPELAMLLFQASFNAKNDRRSRAECDAIRRYTPAAAAAIKCAAALVGWGDAAYEPRALLAELGRIEEPEQLRARLSAQLALLVAAGTARRGDSALADSLLRDTPLLPGDSDQLLFRSAALAARGRVAEARAIQYELQKSPRGRRAARSHTRLLAL